jgi:hypothetical protein
LRIALAASIHHLHYGVSKSWRSTSPLDYTGLGVVCGITGILTWRRRHFSLFNHSGPVGGSASRRSGDRLQIRTYRLPNRIAAGINQSGCDRMVPNRRNPDNSLSRPAQSFGRHGGGCLASGFKLPFTAGANASERIRAAQKDRHPRHQQYKLSGFLMLLWLKASRPDIACLQVDRLRDTYWSRGSSRRLNKRLQLLCESFSGDLHGRVTLGPQLMPDVLKGAAAARPCKLKGAFQVRGALVHGVELSTIERRGTSVGRSDVPQGNHDRRHNPAEPCTRQGVGRQNRRVRDGHQ